VANDAEAQLREKAKDLLAKGKVALVVGYGKRPGGGVRPLFVRAAEDAERLVWNAECSPNLAGYLTREPCVGIMHGGGRVGIIVKGCDARSVVGLLQEKQLTRQAVHVIGLVCDGVTASGGASGPAEPTKCFECEWHTPPISDDLIGDKAAVKARVGDALADDKRIESMSNEERWQFWTSLFARCIKCYACRQACPLCYCKECITEKSRPQWIAKSSTARGNLAYHFIRAMHLAGRCVGCEECRRACPMGIPVDLLSRFLTRRVEEAFGYKPGKDPAAEPFFTVTKENDPDDFIR
jgi:formate dehydrogenase (coenzyme F420) beta subunit